MKEHKKEENRVPPVWAERKAETKPETKPEEKRKETPEPQIDAIPEKPAKVFPLPRVEDKSLYLKDGQILSLVGATGTQLSQPVPGGDTFFALMFGKHPGPMVQVASAGEGRELEALVKDWLKG
jgi:hypothetical protein